MLYAVVNPVRGLLGREISEEHMICQKLQQEFENINKTRNGYFFTGWRRGDDHPNAKELWTPLRASNRKQRVSLFPSTNFQIVRQKRQITYQVLGRTRGVRVGAGLVTTSSAEGIFFAAFLHTIQYHFPTILEPIEQPSAVCARVCVFFPFILDIKFVGRTSRGHTGGRSHRISHPPAFCGACPSFSRAKDSVIPFPRRPLSRILNFVY